MAPMTDPIGDLRLWGYRDHVAEAVAAGGKIEAGDRTAAKDRSEAGEGTSAGGGIAASTEVGRVVQVDRGECDVATAAGVVRAGSDSVRAQAEVAPVTGDWVLLRCHSDGVFIGQVLPRHTALTRRDPAERDADQVLAANFDIVGIVAGLDRPLPPGRFERMLVMALDTGAEIVILLTKADRVPDVAPLAATVTAVAGDVEVLALSVRSGLGVSDLRSRLGPGRTLALVGASGSGKSSLVNALAGDEVAATADVRASDRRGRHTTIARRLVLLPGHGGMVLDTPGVRALGLTDAQEALVRVFGDIEDLARDCRFADCAHGAEPDCSVSAAVNSDELDPRRVQRFLALRAEIEQHLIREQRRTRSRHRR